MYRHILLATDGSPRSRHAIAHGLRLAKHVGAKVLAVHVSPEHLPPVGLEVLSMSTLPMSVFEDAIRDTAKRCLDVVATAAKQAGVTCRVRHVRALSAADAIVDVARASRCDLIVIGAHGYGAARQFLLGSTTTRVMAQCDVPVLVHREPRRRKSP